jgi:hypothetical protein
MEVIYWHAIGLFAGALTLGLFVGRIDDVWGGFLGVVSWGLFAFGALNLTRTTRCCVTRFSEPAVAAFGVILAGICLVLALLGSGRLMDPRSEYEVIDRNG